MSQTIDLYAVLGVARTATEKEIKRAYHKLSNVHHPDKGGDPEVFKRISLAYEVLIDPERRKLYDETGKTEQENIALSLVCQFLMNELLKALSVGQDLGKVDVMKGIREQIKVQRENSRKTALANRKRADKLREAAERFSVDSGENVLQKAALRPIVDLEAEAAKLEEEVENLDRAAEIASQYTYRFDAVGPFSSPFGTIATTKIMGISNGKFVTFGE